MGGGSSRDPGEGTDLCMEGPWSLPLSETHRLVSPECDKRTLA